MHTGKLVKTQSGLDQVARDPSEELYMEVPKYYREAKAKD